MTLKKFLYYDTTIDTYKEQASSDSLALGGLDMSGNISMTASSRIYNCNAATETGDAIVYGQSGAAIQYVTCTGELAMGNNNITNLSPSDANDLASVATLEASGNSGQWLDDYVELPRMVSNAYSATAPTGAVKGDSWICNGWSGYTTGYVYEWSGSSWVQKFTSYSTKRFIITHDSAGGDFTGHENEIAYYDSGWSFTSCSAGDACTITAGLTYGAIAVFNGERWLITETKFFERGYGVYLDSSDNLIVDPGEGLYFPGANLTAQRGSGNCLLTDATNGWYINSNTQYFNCNTSNEGAIKLSVNNVQGGLQATANGLAVLCEDATLATDSSGLRVDGMPSQFKINNSAVAATVTADNLSELCIGGDATSLHTHGSAPSQKRRCGKSLTAGTTLSKGDPVYVNGSNQVDKARADNETKSWSIGVASTDITSSSSGLITFYGLAYNVLSSATPGTKYYVGTSGGLTTTAPGASYYKTLIGIAATSTDLWVEPRFFGLQS